MDWKQTAERLKRLRNDKEISHDKLAKHISENYANITSNSLKKYEVSDELHCDYEKVKGMKIEYLYSLSDFYGVSADYILGKSDYKFPDISLQQIPEKLGLSEKAINELIMLKENDDLKWVNLLLENHLIYQIGLALKMYQKLYINHELYKINDSIERNDLTENNLDEAIKSNTLNKEDWKYEYYITNDLEPLDANIPVPIPIAKNLYSDLLKDKFINLINTCLQEDFEKNKEEYIKKLKMQ